MDLLLCLVLVWTLADGKVSKTMRNILNYQGYKSMNHEGYKSVEEGKLNAMPATEEGQDCNKKPKLRVKSVKELRNIFSPSYTGASKGYSEHPATPCSDRNNKVVGRALDIRHYFYVIHSTF